MNSIGSVRSTPVVRSATPARPAAAGTSTSAAKPTIQAQGRVKDASKWTGTTVGGIAGAVGGCALLLLLAFTSNPFGIFAWGFVPAIGALGAYLGQKGGKQLGAWLEGEKLRAPSAANVVGGVLGGALGLMGGFWGGVALSSLLNVAGMGLVIPVAVAVTTLGAVGGGVALRELTDKVAGK